MGEYKDSLLHLAKTNQKEISFKSKRARGSYIYDNKNRAYLDFVSGVSVCNLGHNNRYITKAIKKQLKKHSHIMVYGEFIQEIQVRFANLLSSMMPDELNSYFFSNSGCEAIEGAIKLAIKHTNRYKIISTKGSYHGSSLACLSISDNKKVRTAFSPILPNIKFIKYNHIEHLSRIDNNTACVIIEPIQSASGFVCADLDYLKALREKCNKTNTLLIFDEIQTGIGRTGKLFCFENYGILPDIIVMGKALGGGLPIGCLCSSSEIMNSLNTNPELGHISTFGGHPLVMASGLASLEILNKGDIIAKVKDKEKIFRGLLSKNKHIKKINGKGLLLALLFEDENICSQVKEICFQKKLLTFQNLYNTKSLRITPAINIKEKDIIKGSKIILEAIKNI